MQGTRLVSNEPGSSTLARDQSLQRLEVIVKVAERCNLNCTYCYFFHGGDESFRTHPAYISGETIAAIADFLREGARALHLQEIRIIFHGGEPLLIGTARFASMCEQFLASLAPITNVTFSVQTNAVLIQQGWIDVFEQYHIHVGVSMDGPAEYNDKARLDLHGKGTYQRVAQGISILQQAAAAKRIERPGVLCVIHPEHSARYIYRHFVDALGFCSLDFLLPDTTYDGFTNDFGERYGRFLCDLFVAWTEDDNPNIRVRLFNSLLSLMLGGPSFVGGYGTRMPFAVTIGSDGSLGPEDTLRVCGPEVSHSGMNVKNSTLEDYFQSTFVLELQDAYREIADSCRTCCWERVCGGGALVNRYRKGEGFKHPSIYCAGLKRLYTQVATYMLANGLSLEKLQNTLTAVHEFRC